jgi:nucleotide-binding universal stress UspA family protein
MRHVPKPFSGLAPRPVNRILVGVSVNRNDERVLAAAGALGLTTHASLTIVHATEPMDGGLFLETFATLPEDGHAWLTAAVDRWLPRGVAHALEVLPGPAHRVLMEVAARTSPDLIVVGATAHEGKLLGSTAERVVGKASVPVLVVRGRLTAAPRRVIAPVDLSELSACGLHCGLAMASRLAGGLELQVVTPFAIGFLDPMSREMRESGWAIDEMAARACERLDEFVDGHLPDVALTIEKRVVLGPAREEILGAAKLESADLIVMSTHGYGGFERLVLGSVAATIVREAPCSVLLVPPEAAFCDSIAEAIVSQTAPCNFAHL